jgi:hypothetical protein
MKVPSLKSLKDAAIAEALLGHDLSSFRADFSGRVWFEGREIKDLTAPPVTEGAYIVSHIEAVRTQIVEPRIIQMVEECDRMLVFSEGREEGRLWRDAHRLGLAIFLSVDPLVAAMRERKMRASNGHEIPSLLEIMKSVMRADLDNAERQFKPIFIDDNPELFTGHMSAKVAQALKDRRQVVVPTSAIDANAVFGRVVRLAQQAGLLQTANHKRQTSIL